MKQTNLILLKFCIPISNNYAVHYIINYVSDILYIHVVFCGLIEQEVYSEMKLESMKTIYLCIDTLLTELKDSKLDMVWIE